MVELKHGERMESIAKEEAPPTTAEELAAKSELQKMVNPNESDKEDTEGPEKQDNPSHEQNNNNQDNNNKSKAMTEEGTLRAKDTSDKEITPVCEVDPKEWHQIHDKWLHTAMWVTMGDMMLASIPDIENVECLERKPLAINLHLHLA